MRMVQLHANGSANNNDGCDNGSDVGGSVVMVVASS